MHLWFSRLTFTFPLARAIYKYLCIYIHTYIHIYIFKQRHVPSKPRGSGWMEWLGVEPLELCACFCPVLPRGERMPRCQRTLLSFEAGLQHPLSLAEELLSAHKAARRCLWEPPSSVPVSAPALSYDLEGERRAPAAGVPGEHWASPHPLWVKAWLAGAKSLFACWLAGSVGCACAQGGWEAPWPGVAALGDRGLGVTLSANPLPPNSHVRAPCSWGGRMGENSSQKKQICVIAG